MPKPKGEEIKARVSAELKRALLDYANSKDWSESFILREAVTEYLAEHGPPEPKPPSQPVHYKIKRRRKGQNPGQAGGPERGVDSLLHR
jgi:hypothetical protein